MTRILNVRFLCSLSIVNQFQAFVLGSVKTGFLKDFFVSVVSYNFSIDTRFRGLVISSLQGASLCNIVNFKHYFKKKFKQKMLSFFCTVEVAPLGGP